MATSAVEAKKRPVSMRSRVWGSGATKERSVPRDRSWSRNGDTDIALEDRTRARILLAEDDAAMRRMVANTLRRAGYDVWEVEDGNELLSCLADRVIDPDAEVDLVISDIRMPGKTGLAVLEGLRKSDWSMPVVFITAFGDESVHEEAKRLGAVTTLDKPFDLDELKRVVHSVVPPVLPT